MIEINVLNAKERNMDRQSWKLVGGKL